MVVMVVGLGAVGSAAAWRLAVAGHRVIGFDRWAPPHIHGSTHGETRITRMTAWEGAEYVPLVRRANALRHELEAATGESFYLRTGGLFLAPPDDEIVAGSHASAEAHALPYEILDAAAVVARWPHLTPSEGQVGFVDPDAGMLFPERMVSATLARAAALGADLHVDEPMLSWRVDGAGVAVVTAQRTYRADRIILCTGAWMPEVLRPLDVELGVERLTLHWFAARKDGPPIDPAHAPVHVIADPKTRATAVFPAMDGSIKVGMHGGGAFGAADAIDRSIRPEDVAAATSVLRRFLPRSAGDHLRSATCLYTLTPNGHFILDHHPVHPQVVLGSPCNGFGFKFAAATGEALACLATDVATPVDLTPWKLPR